MISVRSDGTIEGRPSLGCQLCQLWQMAPQTSEYALGEAVRIEGALRVTKLLPMAAKLPCRVLHGSNRK